ARGLVSVLDLADRLLVDAGRLALATLVSPGRPAPALIELAAWASRYVSEAGPPVAWADLTDAVGRSERLTLRGRLESTSHHAETVRLWSETFANRGRDAAALGFDAVYRRLWAFQLASTEAGLRRGWTESVPLVVGADTSPADPGTSPTPQGPRMTSILTPVAVWLGRQDATRENSHLVVGLDRWLDRISRGRVPLLRIAGLPPLVLHVPGRRSGVERSTPLLCASWGNGLVIVGSNWGGDSVPAWVHNLRAARPGTVATSVQGTRMLVDVRELSGAERAPAWGAAMRVWPNYAIYAGRTSRLIPVFHLTPRLDGPARQDA